MSKTFSVKEQVKCLPSKGPNWGLILASLILLISFAFYLPLLDLAAKSRPEVVHYFLHLVFPRALTHIAILLLLNLVFKVKARGTLIFWGLSIIALFAASGISPTVAFALLVIFAIILTGIGDALARMILPESTQGWGLSLALGILAVSVMATFLALVHLFKVWTMALLLLLAFLLSMWRARTWIFSRVSAGWDEFSSHWNLALALALESAFLLGLFIFVAATAPETRSDALRFYWPYVKVLKHDATFFGMPFQWNNIIPQAGLTYAATIFLLLGPLAVRWAMFLAWLALVGIACRRQTKSPSGVALAFAMVMASCPLFLLVTASLLQDTFVSLVTVVMAFVCLEGKNPGSKRFWAAVGGLIGVAWTAKYTTLAYAAPLGLCALARSWKATGWRENVRGLGIAATCGLLAAAPWLWHAYRQSGNPLFPFFLKIFPAPAWPSGVGGAGSLTTFPEHQLLPGLRGLLLWPIDMTYRSLLFGEGTGALGMVLPVLLVLVTPALWKSSATPKALVISSVVGTGLLWTMTTQFRYWLPGLWLFTLAVTPGAVKLARSGQARTWLCFLALTLCLFHPPFAMAADWFNPKGWPWDYYSGKIKEEDYIDWWYGGFKKLNQLKFLYQGWPRVWFTNFEAAGHLPVRPIEALIWELSFHTKPVPRSIIQFLGSTGCEYWIVNRHGQDARWLKDIGVPHCYWDEKSLVASDGPIAMYKMKAWQEALQAFDERARPGTDLLLNGGFEKGVLGYLDWWPAEARWIFPTSDAQNGKGYVQVGPGKAFAQVIALPPGLKQVELNYWARAASPGQRVSVQVPLVWADLTHRFLSQKVEVVLAQGEWKQYRLTDSVPSEAVYATLELNNPAASGDAHFDEVHLYSREER